MKSYNTEAEYLIHLINSVLNGTMPDEKPEQLSFEGVYRLAEFHSIANMAFYAVERLNGKPDDELYKKWSRQRDSAIIKDTVQFHEQGLIISSFENEHIRYMLLKGFALKELYPSTDMRLMSDIDILIDGEDAVMAKGLMEALGYDAVHFNAGKDDVYQKKPVMNVEIHRDLLEKSDEGLIIIDKIIKENKTEKGTHYILKPTYFYLYILAHSLRHYFKGGTGIRTILDLYLYFENHKADIDLDMIEKLMKQADCYEMYTDLISLADVWFAGAEHSDKTKKAERYILSSGVYGTVTNHSEYLIKKKGKGGYLLSSLFPKTEELALSYPILKKAPFLTPIFWIVRLITKPFTSWGRVKAKVKSLFKK